MSDIFVHSSSHVEKGAQIGKESKIWINVQIRSTSVVGENCIISKDVYIDSTCHSFLLLQIPLNINSYYSIRVLVPQ